MHYFRNICLAKSSDVAASKQMTCVKCYLFARMTPVFISEKDEYKHRSTTHDHLCRTGAMISANTFVYFIVWLFMQQGIAQAFLYACNVTAPCGCSTNDVNINARIVGGEVAATHSLGWSVSLRVSQSRHFCGGTILSPRFILTAAHCLEDLTSSYGRITVAVGTDQLYDNVGQRLSVSRIYLHPRWNTRTKENDIALIKLTRKIDVRNRNSARLCLPPMGEVNANTFPPNQSSMVAIGWGTTQSSGSVSNQLRQVTLQAVDSTAPKCRVIVKNAALQFCAAVDGGGKGKL